MDIELPEKTDREQDAPVPSETASRELDPELLEGLRLLDNSQSLIRTIFLGMALQYRSLDVQRCELLLQAKDPEATLCGPGPIALQNAASLTILCALFGFQKQAEELAAQAARAGMRPDLLDVKLGATSILIALFRLMRLNLAGGAPGLEVSSGSEEQELLEITNDPADLSL